ncbi:TetR/AcrR family transcriptional regulator [Myxococcus stipitatus]|uniref:TetR/AcrR family transcriptional regulator n=1 Tax=Myxococcus stipitatus TaxID=83455 RepID=UPI001F1E1DB4|nr:helix-turn-helix domain-containing protein [Myxococcus stipitatus]MCE9669721.1 TetR/AcrR family transcriptional regulator [Myxococcus stipitatus]
MLGWPWFDLIVAPPCARHVEGTRDRLLSAARRLVREEGPEGLTLEAVARRALVGRGAPRYHFGSKRGLLEALARQPPAPGDTPPRAAPSKPAAARRRPHRPRGQGQG